IGKCESRGTSIKVRRDEFMNPYLNRRKRRQRRICNLVLVIFVIFCFENQRNSRARKSSRGSSKLQLPNDLTNLRRYCSRSMSIFHSRHAKKSSPNENEVAFSPSSMVAACFASHRCSAAR